MANDMDIFKALEKHPDEAAKATSLAEFAELLGTDKPGTGRWLAWIAEQSDYWDLTFRTYKAHGMMGGTLRFPDIRKVRDLFDRVDLDAWEVGKRDYRPGSVGISAIRAQGFAYFGRLEANYEWLEDKGHGRISGGTNYTTRGDLKPEISQWWAKHIGEREGWELSHVEAIEWKDGRTLIVGGAANSIASRWLCVLDPGESALDLMSEHERGEIEAEKARKAEIFERVPQ